MTDPASGSGQTEISASLNGDWPEDPTIYADVQFLDNTTPRTFSSHGQSVLVGEPSGALVSTAKVWVRGTNAPAIECNIWVRQP